MRQVIVQEDRFIAPVKWLDGNFVSEMTYTVLGGTLYCTVYCTVLYFTVLYCTVLYCTVLYCIVLLLKSVLKHYVQ